VDGRIVDIQEFLKRNWPDVPNYTFGNECLPHSCITRLGGNTSLPTGRQAKPCNAGLVDMEWVIEDLTKSEVQ
jgi:hypothetical protein